MHRASGAPARLFAIAACLVATYLLFAVTAMRVALQGARSAGARSAQPHRGRSDRPSCRTPASSLAVDESGRLDPKIPAGRIALQEPAAGRDHAPPAQHSRLGEPGPAGHSHSRTDRRDRARGAAAPAAGRPRGQLARRSALVRLPERHRHRAGARRRSAQRHRGRAAGQSRRAGATTT